MASVNVCDRFHWPLPIIERSGDLKFACILRAPGLKFFDVNLLVLELKKTSSTSRNIGQWILSQSCKQSSSIIVHVWYEHVSNKRSYNRQAKPSVIRVYIYGPLYSIAFYRKKVAIFFFECWTLFSPKLRRRQKNSNVTLIYIRYTYILFPLMISFVFNAGGKEIISPKISLDFDHFGAHAVSLFIHVSESVFWRAWNRKSTTQTMIKHAI